MELALHRASSISGSEADIAIHFEGVNKAYSERGRKEYVALSDLNLRVRESEFYCLLGPSGCGKSTALNLLAGFEVPSGGRVVHRGKVVTAPGPDRGVIFQGDDSLYPWRTAVENIEFGLQMKGKSRSERALVAEKYLALVGLEGQGHKFPRELSGGMRQRIQIARVLANQPTTLLMDEPFAALDAQTRKIMQEELVRIWQIEQRNVLFITHDIIEALVLGDRIGVMRAGPGAQIREEIAVDLPRPRDRTDPKLIQLYRQVEKLVEEEVFASRRVAAS